MKYVEYAVETTTEAEELVSEILLRYTDYGVSVQSDFDARELIEKRNNTFDYVDESVFSVGEGLSVVKGCFPVDSAKEYLLAIERDLDELKRTSEGFIDAGSLSISERTFDGDDWIKIRRAALKPIEFDRLCVCLAEADVETDKEKIMIATDLAFGMGDHETTSLCIRFLEKYVKSGDTVVDVGTGSGILGICSAKLGAKKVYMTDIDPVAVESAKVNVEINGVGDICFPTLDNLMDGLNIESDLVVANITADILILLRDEVKKYLAAGGTLIMSGILNEKVVEVENAYSEAGFDIIEKTSSGEWTGVVARKLRTT